MITEAEADRRDQLLARVGELHVLADELKLASDEDEYSAAFRSLEDVLQNLREL